MSVCVSSSEKEKFLLKLLATFSLADVSFKKTGYFTMFLGLFSVI